VTAYGTSAKGGTLAAYRTVCRSIIGGDLNVWRRFSGIPQPGEPMQICSTKDRSRTAMADRRAGFAAYGLPCVDVWWHEPFGGDGDYPATDAGYGLYLDDAEALLTDHATNVVRALCFQRADAVKGGNVDKALKTLPPYVDLLLFDGYRDKPVGGRTAKEMLAPCIAQSQRLGVGYGLAEWGVAGTAIERVKFGHELVEETCRDGGCYVLSHFESDVGDPDRVPTNYDGSKAWAIAKSSDRYTPEMSNLWRDLAALSRREAARLGSPATF
jgi:hypothetical protein